MVQAPDTISCVATTGSPLCQSHVVLSLYSTKAAWSSLVWLPHLGLNHSANLPLQPHFRLLLQSVTPASIPLYFQLYWAAIVSLGRCGPMAWSQSSPSSHTGAVTRGSCFPDTSWVEVTPISLLRAWPQLFNISMKPVKGYRYVK